MGSFSQVKEIKLDGELTDASKISTPVNKTFERGTNARDGRLLRKHNLSF